MTTSFLQKEIIVDMTEPNDDEDYIEVDQVEIVVEEDCILDHGESYNNLPSVRPPLIVRLRRLSQPPPLPISTNSTMPPPPSRHPPPPDITDTLDQNNHLHTCMTLFTGLRKDCPPDKMLLPRNTTVKTVAMPYYTREFIQAMLYTQTLFEHITGRPAFAKVQWDPNRSRLQFLRSMYSISPTALDPVIREVIRSLVNRWHRGDLIMALAILFMKPFDNVTTSVNTILDQATTAVLAPATQPTNNAILAVLPTENEHHRNNNEPLKAVIVMDDPIVIDE